MSAAAEKEPIIFLDDISVTFKTRTGSLLHPNLVHAVNHVTIKLMPGERSALWASPVVANPPPRTSCAACSRRRPARSISRART